MHDHLSALPRQHLKTIQGGMMRYQWRGIRCNKPPFDLALYPVLLWQQKPRTIIEIGTSEGGSALWLADTCRALELETRIISIDLYQHAKVKDPHITFLQGDGRALGAVLTDDFMRSLPHPLLVIEDADHHYLTTLAVLDFMARHLQEGEY